jgi:hypothetical protein
LVKPSGHVASEHTNVGGSSSDAIAAVQKAAAQRRSCRIDNDGVVVKIRW